MKLIITAILFVATSAVAQDSPYRPNVNSSYETGYTRSTEASKYDLRRDNWRDEVEIRRELSRSSNGSTSSGHYQGKPLRTPDAPPSFHTRMDYGKSDAWKKSNDISDELSCRSYHSDVLRMQADLDGIAYKKLDKRRMDYHSYLSLITEGSQRLRGPGNKIRKYAAVGTNDQCEYEYQQARAIYEDVMAKINRHEEDFTSLRGTK